MRLGEKSPAQVYALVLGVVLVVAGVAGFFWSASFALGTSAGVEQDFLLGVLAVNGWHNVVHLLTGAVGLALVGSYAGARLYALTLGLVYLLIALLGFVAASNDALFGLLAINVEDNILHILIGVAGAAAGLATPAEPRAATAASGQASR
jgi:hypothetical protein